MLCTPVNESSLVMGKSVLCNVSVWNNFLPPGPLSSSGSNTKVADTTDNVEKIREPAVVIAPQAQEVAKENIPEKVETESRDQVEEMNFGLLRKKNAFLANDIAASESAAVAVSPQPKRPAR